MSYLREQARFQERSIVFTCIGLALIVAMITPMAITGVLAFTGWTAATSIGAIASFFLAYQARTDSKRFEQEGR